jgi:hypothetical protein
VPTRTEAVLSWPTAALDKVVDLKTPRINMEDIRPRIKKLIADDKLKGKDLVERTGYSKTAISLWLSGGYNRDATRIEAAIRDAVKDLLEEEYPVLGDLNGRDHIRLTEILKLIDDADDPGSLLAALSRFRRHECAATGS